MRVEPAAQVAEDRFDTGAYDWQAIGLIADTVKIPAPVDPRAYVPGGQFDALLRYAVGKIDRFKLRVLFSGQSMEQAGNYLLPKTFDDALQPLMGRIASDPTRRRAGQAAEPGARLHPPHQRPRVRPEHRHLCLSLPGRPGQRPHGLARERREHEPQAGHPEEVQRAGPHPRDACPATGWTSISGR